MSWPSNSVFSPSDPQSKCRCEIDRPEPTEFTFGTDNCGASDGLCGNNCAVCTQSWPIDSPFADPWTEDPFANCRCQQEAPAPAPTPLDEPQLTFGKECTGRWQNKSRCRDGCACHISWPADDPLAWNSPEKACRCLPRQRAAEGYTYSEDRCSRPDKGTCDGSCDCVKSWPKDDPLGEASVEQMCRCKPPQETFVRTFGSPCGSLYNGLCGADCHACLSNWVVNGPNDGQCRCPASEIREVVWGAESCASNREGKCGNYCRDCRQSWELGDTDGSTIDCRCRNWWGR